MKDKTRKNEEKLVSLFSERKPFSEHLLKWEDRFLPDKYDQNFFEYVAQPTGEEFRKAVEYQKKLGAGFIKFEGDDPLEESFGLEAGVTLTMLLKSDGAGWKTNPDLTFCTPGIEELEELEVRH
ncbi:MAG: GNAT family N-acetyltransferase, partial [Clostridia bacterium]|nr:GNAT family N-acetyltransferase [Clostridia bacterium]